MKRVQRISLMLVLLSFLALSGCTVRLIGDYDSVLDQGMTDFQQKTETFLSKLAGAHGTPEAAYAANKDFYNDVKGSLATMRTRSAGEAKSQLITKEIELLQKSVDDMEKLHKLAGAGGLSVDTIETTRTLIEVHVESFMKLELALKRGKSTSFRYLPMAPDLETQPRSAQGE